MHRSDSSRPDHDHHHADWIAFEQQLLHDQGSGAFDFMGLFTVGWVVSAVMIFGSVTWWIGLAAAGVGAPLFLLDVPELQRTGFRSRTRFRRWWDSLLGGGLLWLLLALPGAPALVIQDRERYWFMLGLFCEVVFLIGYWLFRRRSRA